MPQTSEHHQHQLGSVLHNISIRWTLNKRSSSASAGMFLAQGTQSASIISISWTLAWQVPQTSEHHQHQLGCFLHRGTRSDSIISITWTLARQVQHNTEHHQHQLGCFLHRRTEPASIISIKTLGELPIGSPPNKPTSSASAGLLLAQGTKSASSISIRWTLAWQVPQTSEHHRHQLGCVSLGWCTKQASIISISWTLAWADAPNKRTSSASAGLLLRQISQHHQLGRCPKQPNISISSACFLYKGTKSASISIISISWAASCTGAPNQSASSASAGLWLGRCPKQANIISISWAASCTSLASAGLAWQVHQTSEHHQHELGWFLSLGRGTKQASIISISAVLHRSTTSASIISIRWTKQVNIISSSWAPNQPASSASAGLSLGKCTKQANIISISWAVSCTGQTISQHHQHQLDSGLAGAPNKRTSSASAGLLLAQGDQIRQHHQHHLDSRLAGAAQHRAPSASAGLLFAQAHRTSQHHQH